MVEEKKIMNINNISIKNKLILMQVFTAAVLLGLCIAVFVVTDISSFKERKVEEMNAIAQVISLNSLSAIKFLDNETANRILSDLNVKPDIVNAAILDNEGNVFATYTRRGAFPIIFQPKSAKEEKYKFEGNDLFIYNAIEQGNHTLGIVCLQAELSQLQEVRNQKFKTGFLVFVLGLMLSFIMVFFVQRTISRPIINLAGLMQKVKDTGDYKSRSPVKGNDEINTLSLMFNDMLGQIERREMGIKERTAELEMVNKELESFSYTVSHDLRAPVRAINGFIKVVEKKYKDQLGEEGKGLLKIVSDEALRMGQLIDDLLAFSRMRRKEIEKTNVDMTALAREAVNESLKLNQEKYKAKITLNDLPPARCDGALIRQVWVNLISNAIKFSSRKPDPAVEIGSYTEGGLNVYYVKDNGVGFDMKYYDKLFGVFQRLHSSEEFEGTGIGLAIVKRTIARHGGKVWAEAKVNEGAKFYFSLPAA